MLNFKANLLKFSPIAANFLNSGHYTQWNLIKTGFFCQMIPNQSFFFSKRTFVHLCARLFLFKFKANIFLHAALRLRTWYSLQKDPSISMESSTHNLRNTYIKVQVFSYWPKTFVVFSKYLYVLRHSYNYFWLFWLFFFYVQIFDNVVYV